MNMGLKRQEPWPAGGADWGTAAVPPRAAVSPPPPVTARLAIEARPRRRARVATPPRPRIRPDLIDLSDTREIGALMACVRALMRERPQLVLHVVSASPGEGTSSIARSLARRAAQEPWCATLLLDATDIAAAAPTRRRGDPDDAQGNGPVLFRDRELERLRWATLRPDASGAIPLDLYQLYEDLRARFDLVVVDCPSIADMPDGATLAALADGVIMVAAAEQTRVAVIEHAKALIVKSGGRILGMVLNRRRDYIPQFLYRHL
jgi:protein-tyrosine kinase